MSEFMYYLGLFMAVSIAYELSDNLEIKNVKIEKFHAEIETTISLFTFIPLYFILSSAYYPMVIHWVSMESMRVFLFILLLGLSLISTFSLYVLVKNYEIKRKERVIENAV